MQFRQENQLLRYFVRKHCLLLTVALVAGLLAGLSALLIPLSIGKYYTLALEAGSARGKVFDMLPFRVHNLKDFFFFFSGVIIFHMLAVFLSRQCADTAAEKFVKELREKLFSCQLRQPINKLLHKPVGRYLLRYSGDMGAVKRLISRGMVGFVYDIMLLLLGVALLSYLNFLLSLLILGLTVVFIVLLWLFNLMLLPEVNRLRGTRSSNLAFVSSRLQALMTIKLTSREEKEMRKFNDRSNKLYRQAISLLWRENFQRALIPFLLYSLLLAVLIYGSVLISRDTDKLDGASLLVFIMFLITIIPSFRRLLYARRHWRDGWLSLRKVVKVFRPEEEKKRDVNLDNEPYSLAVTPFCLDDVKGKKLSYPAFEQQKGKISLLIGPSGSGKSLLFYILSGLSEAPEGVITINGIDLKKLSPLVMREQVSLFTVEAPLLGNTLAGVLGNPRREAEERALELLDYFDIDMHRDESLRQEIGSGGKLLSSGEVKILQLIRFLLHDRPIMLLDDPFSNMEHQNQRKLEKLLEKMQADHIIFIALRDEQSCQLNANRVYLDRQTISLYQ
jgi:ABC-type multidrug transport system fused ATPase/permease subunit